MTLVPAQPDPRYPLGSFDDYATLLRDAGRGVSAAVETVKYYQSLARETICRTHGMPIRDCGPAHRPYNAATMGTAVTYRVSTVRELQAALSEIDKRLGMNKKELSQFPVPEGVHFTTHKRVGDVIRDRYLDYLGEMLAGGFIDQAEYSARADAAIKMQTREELESLIQDLPRLPKEETAPAVVKNKPVKTPWPGTSMSGIFFAANLADIFLLPGTWVLFAVFAVFWGILFVISLTIKYRNWKR